MQVMPAIGEAVFLCPINVLASFVSRVADSICFCSITASCVRSKNLSVILAPGPGVLDVLRKHDQIGAHQLQHSGGHPGQPNNLRIAPRAQNFREDVLGNGNPSAWRLVTEKELPLVPTVQELRLVTSISLVRSHDLLV